MVKLEKILFSTDGDTRQFAQQEMIAITGLHLCTDTQSIITRIFREKCLSVYMMELKLTLMQTIFIRNYNAEIVLCAVLVEIKFKFVVSQIVKFVESQKNLNDKLFVK